MKENQKNAKIPLCIGVLMDGNRRWAKEKGLLALEGHKAGYEPFKQFIGWAKDVGIKHLIFYAFSTENWKRSEEEVGYILKLFRNVFKQDLEELKEKKMRMSFIGQISRFPKDIQNIIRELEEETKDNTAGTVTLALSYGGRAEILNAVNTLIKEGRKGSVTEEEFASYLWTKDVPDPDLIIRTGGAMRLSNFLPWQSVYSELYFTETYWPDFDQEEFKYILEEYVSRERRMGK